MAIPLDKVYNSSRKINLVNGRWYMVYGDRIAI
jgi:hypothetical protein